MKVDVATKLDCPAHVAWEEVQKSALLLRIIWPMIRIAPVAPPFPERWLEGSTLRFRSYVFGFIPIGVRTLQFELIDPLAREIATHESDPLVKRWDHCISIGSLTETTCIYRDAIDINAGALTFIVWAWAIWFYRHRQSRWRKIAPTLVQAAAG